MTRRRFLRGLVASGLVPWGCGRELGPPPVVLITLDTTRRDRLGLYGYDRDTSPNLDAFGAGAKVYTRAIAASSWTLPSHASLFTGKFPTSHGARYDVEGPLRLAEAIEGPEGFDQYRARGLSAEETTLAGVLREAGYRTGAVVSGPWMKRVFGLDLGFEHYDDASIDDVNGRIASSVTTAALAWMEDVAGAPFFLFLNYFDPHGPYEAPSPFGGAFESGDGIGDRYDEEIQYMDHHVGRLFDGMKRFSVFQQSLVVVTADHGELLGEHGRFGHGTTLHEEEIRVPFIVKEPNGEPGRSDEPVHHVDVMPLVLEHAGLAFERRPHPLIAEVRPLPFMGTEGDWLALYQGDHKLLWNRLGNHALFDVARDPGELRDLSAADPERVIAMSELLMGFLATLPAPGAAATTPPVKLDEQTREMLRRLGYLP